MIKRFVKLLVKREIAGIIATMHISLYFPLFNLRFRPSPIWTSSLTMRTVDFHVLECWHTWKEQGGFAMKSRLVAPFRNIQDISFPHFSSYFGFIIYYCSCISVLCSISFWQSIPLMLLERGRWDLSKTVYGSKCCYSNLPLFDCYFESNRSYYRNPSWK